MNKDIWGVTTGNKRIAFMRKYERTSKSINIFYKLLGTLDKLEFKWDKQNSIKN